MSHQQRAAFAQTSGGDFDGFDYNPGQLPEPRNVEVEGEERWHRWFNGVAERGDQTADIWTATAGSQEEPVTGEGFTI